MNIDELIEQLHQTNATERQEERMKHIHFRPWWLAIPAAAAVVLLIILPLHGNSKEQQPPSVRVYCNNSCQHDDAMEILRQNIIDIKSSMLEE